MGGLIEWMYRKMGIKRYWVCYRFRSVLVPGCVIEGYHGPCFKFIADDVAAECNRQLNGFHWVERVRSTDARNPGPIFHHAAGASSLP